MADLSKIDLYLRTFLDENVSSKDKVQLLNELPVEVKQVVLKQLPIALKKELVMLKVSQGRHDRQEKEEKIAANKSHLTAVKKAKKVLPLMRTTNEIKSLKRRISQKAKRFTELYYNCYEIGRYWNWIKEEIVHSYSGLEMNMKLEKAISSEEREHIQHIYREEMAATGDAFVKSLEFALLEPQAPITEDFIKSLHRVVLPTEPERAGVYRQIKARLPNTQTVLANYIKVPELMAKMVEEDNKITDPMERAIRFHFDITAIHPFTDGNGRTSRLIMNTILMQNDLPSVIIAPDEKKDYIHALEIYSQKGDDVPYRVFMLKKIEQSLSHSIMRLKYLLHKETKSEERQARRGKKKILMQYKRSLKER